MPFLSAEEFRQPGQTLIAETSYDNSFNTAETLNIYICKPAPQLIEAEIKSSYADVNINSLRAYLNSFDQSALTSLVNSNDGLVKINLDGVDIELKRGQHFFLNAKDRS